LKIVYQVFPDYEIEGFNFMSQITQLLF